MHLADYGRNATTEAGHQAVAVTRTSGHSGVQGAKSEFWNGRRPNRSIFVEDAMTKIIVLVALTFVLVAFSHLASTRTPDPGGSS